jgi:hypothetical protein
MPNYFEKSAMRRIVKELISGNLSQNAHQLARKGLIKRPGQYAAGMERGNAALAAKRNALIREPSTKIESKILELAGPNARMDYKGRGHVITKPNLTNTGGSPFSGKQEGTLITRHELHEVDAMRKVVKNKQTTPVSSVKEFMSDPAFLGKLSPRQIDRDAKKYAFAKPVAFINSVPASGLGVSPDSIGGKKNIGMLAGQHADTSVLARESNDTRGNPFLRKLKGFREASGEASFMQEATGKTFGKDRFNKTDMKKLQKSVTRDVPKDTHMNLPDAHMQNFTGFAIGK